jgi:hypothetical protein
VHENPQDRDSPRGPRAGTFEETADGCTFALDRNYMVRGGEPSLLPAVFTTNPELSTLPPLPSESDPEDPTGESLEGAVDVDGDGRPGVAFRVSGNASGVRNVIQRDWNEYFTLDDRPIPQNAIEFVAGVRFDNQENVLAVSQCPLIGCGILLAGSHRRWELMLNPGEQEPDPWKLLARWVTPDDAQLWRAAAYRFHALVARQWRGGRVFLAGDAAHQQPPFTGQGMCQGIRDAANLSWKLQYVLAGKAGDGLLDTYEAERSAHVRKLTVIIKDIGKIIGERDPKAAAERDRRLLKEAGGKVETVPRQNLIPPLEGGLRSIHPHSANGTLFPKDGKTGMRVVVRSPDDPPYLSAWFERYHALAAIVRPDHYVYGIANSNPALDRQLAGMAKQLA